VRQVVEPTRAAAGARPQATSSRKARQTSARAVRRAAPRHARVSTPFVPARPCTDRAPLYNLRPSPRRSHYRRLLLLLRPRRPLMGPASMRKGGKRTRDAPRPHPCSKPLRGRVSRRNRPSPRTRNARLFPLPTVAGRTGQLNDRAHDTTQPLSIWRSFSLFGVGPRRSGHPQPNSAPCLPARPASRVYSKIAAPRTHLPAYAAHERAADNKLDDRRSDQDYAR